jgi:hypothetical protein
MHPGSGSPLKPAQSKDEALGSGQATPQPPAGTQGRVTGLEADVTANTAAEPGKTAAHYMHAVPWRAAGIRVLILLLAGFLVVFLAYEWNWWTGSLVDQRTDDAYLQADLTPLAA